MRSVCCLAVLAAVAGVGGCDEASFADLPADTEVLVFSSALAEARDPTAVPTPVDPQPCTSLFCYGVSVRVVAPRCLGFSEDATAVIDDLPIELTTRELDQGVATPVNGYLELGGWAFETVGWRCGVPAVEFFPGTEPPILEEHTISITSDGATRALTLADDDGRVLACDFPRCRVTGDWEDLNGLY